MRVRVFSPSFRSRHEVVLGDEELQAIGLPPRPCPVVLRSITVQWVPTWDREEVARLCLRYLHAENGTFTIFSQTTITDVSPGQLVIDCKGASMEGRSGDPLWVGGLWLHAAKPQDQANRNKAENQNTQRVQDSSKKSDEPNKFSAATISTNATSAGKFPNKVCNFSPL